MQMKKAARQTSAIVAAGTSVLWWTERRLSVFTQLLNGCPPTAALINHEVTSLHQTVTIFQSDR